MICSASAWPWKSVHQKSASPAPDDLAEVGSFRPESLGPMFLAPKWIGKWWENDRKMMDRLLWCNSFFHHVEQKSVFWQMHLATPVELDPLGSHFSETHNRTNQAFHQVRSWQKAPTHDGHTVLPCFWQNKRGVATIVLVLPKWCCRSWVA